MSCTKNSPAPTINELSLIRQGENLLYDARLLHRDLKVKSIFQNWIKRRIEEFGFTEGSDYFPNLESKKTGRGGHNSINYLLTLDMCKELAMLERNEIGRAIRRYFIAKEKEARGVLQLPKEAGMFKGLKGTTINGRKMYPYKEFLQSVGYSKRSSGYHYKVGYSGHFVTMGTLSYLSEELALQIFHSRRLTAARATNKAMQPVLPFNFGEPLQLKGGRSNG